MHWQRLKTFQNLKNKVYLPELNKKQDIEVRGEGQGGFRIAHIAISGTLYGT